MPHTSVLTEKGLKAVIDAIPSPVFIFDSNIRIVHANAAGLAFLDEPPEKVLNRVAGDGLHCVNAGRPGSRCGQTEFCPECIVRNSIEKVVETKATVRKRGKFRLMLHGMEEEVQFAVTASPFEFDHMGYYIVVLNDITELVALRSILPICANCKKVRNDEQYWEQVEEYLKKHLDMNFTHSICPDCFDKLYPDISRERKGGPRPPQ